MQFFTWLYIDFGWFDFFWMKCGSEIDFDCEFFRRRYVYLVGVFFLLLYLFLLGRFIAWYHIVRISIILWPFHFNLPALWIFFYSFIPSFIDFSRGNERKNAWGNHIHRYDIQSYSTFNHFHFSILISVNLSFSLPPSLACSLIISLPLSLFQWFDFFRWQIQRHSKQNSESILVTNCSREE